MSFPRYPKYKESGVQWLGEVPAHWAVMRFQRCIDVVEGQVDPEAPEFANLPLIAPNHVESGTGRLLELESATSQGAESGKYLCRSGDVVYSKIRPGLRKACIAPRECLCSADMYPLRARTGLTNGYLLWLMLSEQFSSFAVLESQRVAMPKINRESLKEVAFAFPSEAEQKTIAAFLRDETNKIDVLIAQQERLIELLQEKRQAVISHAVTKGLNPDAPMKPSGVEWLGDVPQHWDVKKLRFLCDIETGGRDTEDAIPDGEYPFFVRSQTVERIDTFAFDCEAVLTAGDGAGVGKVFHHFAGRFDCHQRVYALTSFRGISGRFLFHYLRENFYKIALEGGAKSTVDSLRRPMFQNFWVSCPPLEEQQTIVAAIERDASKIDALVAEAERAITLLSERRTALISAAVTGQIDVRGYEGKEQAA